jgi:hypothetical protein
MEMEMGGGDGWLMVDGGNVRTSIHWMGRVVGE